MKRNLLLLLAAVLIVMQFFGINKVNPETPIDQDFIHIHKPPQKIENILRAACYDCHSHETVYPWYTSVAPLSWWINNHIVHGREELNFSTWSQYSTDKADHKLEECIEYVSENKMPLSSYTWTHPEARLSESDKKELNAYFASLRK